MSSSPTVHPEADWRPLREDPAPPETETVRAVAQYVLNTQTKQNLGIRRWRRHPSFVLDTVLSPTQTETSDRITFNSLCDHLTQHRTINHAAMAFPKILSPWLDKSVAIGLQFCAVQNDDPSKALTITVPPTNISKDFPVHPTIDREGLAFSSMQLTIQAAILSLRSRLISESKTMFTLSSPWLHDLISYFNHYVSIVDITLMQLYYYAQFEGHAFGWNFDAYRLGSTVGRSIEDKLRWIGQITGRSLDNARDELVTFKQIKSVRNHLNHYDPPCFACTLEDVVIWLNAVQPLGRLLQKIREKLDTQVSESIIAMQLAPLATFEPRDPGKPRPSITDSVGYITSTWKNAEHT